MKRNTKDTKDTKKYVPGILEAVPQSAPTFGIFVLFVPFVLNLLPSR